MLKEMPDDIKQAQDMGISLYLGETGEGRLDDVLKDAWAGELKPSYGDMINLPDMQGVPIPYLPKDIIDRSFNSRASLTWAVGARSSVPSAA